MPQIAPRWTLAEFERLIETGILTEDDRVELIQGVLVPMAPKSDRHELVRDEILNSMIQRKPPTIRLSSEIGWRPPDADTYVEPDLLICPRSFKGVTVPPTEVLLAIEVAHSSLRFDSTTKAKLYAALGVSEYWVVDAQTLTTRVHREPSADGYATPIRSAAEPNGGAAAGRSPGHQARRSRSWLDRPASHTSRSGIDPVRMAGETAIGGRPAEHWGGSMARVCGSVPCGIQQIFSRWIARSRGPPVDSGGPSQGRR